eukprot:TRINITY_DN7338_c0_g1_i2.p1 TRINITY_DN7338_c0_g1~~TRINITY_DN7338_c0_g1_i2.p1  ORF type:complete len:602 (-),score=93.10 TRINITY_DN7338_c0_g1_i2:176-1981(-)
MACRGHALLVGCQNYVHQEVPQNRSDVVALGRCLHELELDVKVIIDPTATELTTTFSDYATSVVPGLPLIIYFAGHVVTVADDTLLLGMNATLTAAESFGYSLTQLFHLIASTALRSPCIVIVDASHPHNYQPSIPSTSLPFRNIEPCIGSMLVYTRCASLYQPDPAVEYSVLAHALMFHLRAAVDIEVLLRLVRAQVLHQSNGQLLVQCVSALIHNVTLSAEGRLEDTATLEQVDYCTETTPFGQPIVHSATEPYTAAIAPHMTNEQSMMKGITTTTTTTSNMQPTGADDNADGTVSQGIPLSSSAFPVGEAAVMALPVRSQIVQTCLGWGDTVCCCAVGQTVVSVEQSGAVNITRPLGSRWQFQEVFAAGSIDTPQLMCALKPQPATQQLHGVFIHGATSNYLISFADTAQLQRLASPPLFHNVSSLAAIDDCIYAINALGQVVQWNLSHVETASVETDVDNMRRSTRVVISEHSGLRALTSSRGYLYAIHQLNGNLYRIDTTMGQQTLRTSGWQDITAICSHNDVLFSTDSRTGELCMTDPDSGVYRRLFTDPAAFSSARAIVCLDGHVLVLSGDVIMMVVANTAILPAAAVVVHTTV